MSKVEATCNLGKSLSSRDGHHAWHGSLPPPCLVFAATSLTTLRLFWFFRLASDGMQLRYTMGMGALGGFLARDKFV